MQNEKTGSGDTFSDWAAVILAAILFFRTADVLGYFSPPILNNIVGFDVSWIYGVVTAFFVEGVALAYHFNPKAKNYTPAKIVKWILLIVSGVCQVFDGHIITGTLADMPDTQKLIFQIGVPLLPLFVLFLLFFVGHLPDTVQTKPFKGVKNYLPDWKRVWEGEQQNSEFSPKVTEQLEKISDKADEVRNPNGHSEKVVNPTNRQT